MPLVEVADMASEAVAKHLRSCDGFSFAVMAGKDRWDWPSPCPAWNAGRVVEHVIGFHDVLLLRPLHATRDRPKGDPVKRWAVTVLAISEILPRVDDNLVVPVPDAPAMDLARLLPMLTIDVLAHTWDLAKAVEAPVLVDPQLCVDAYRAARRSIFSWQESEMFGPSVPVSDDADPVTKLVALLGRDPGWTTSAGDAASVR